MPDRNARGHGVCRVVHDAHVSRAVVGHEHFLVGRIKRDGARPAANSDASDDGVGSGIHGHEVVGQGLCDIDESVGGVAHDAGGGRGALGAGEGRAVRLGGERQEPREKDEARDRATREDQKESAVPRHEDRPGWPQQSVARVPYFCVWGPLREIPLEGCQPNETRSGARCRDRGTPIPPHTPKKTGSEGWTRLRTESKTLFAE